jgi:hypothetical protein
MPPTKQPMLPAPATPTGWFAIMPQSRSSIPGIDSRLSCRWLPNGDRIAASVLAL